MKENKEYEITKSNREDWIGVTFQCHIINKGVNVAPKWFRDFEKKNDARWVKQEEFNKYVVGFIKHQEQFNKQQTEFNERVSNFIKHVTDIFERNKLK